MHFYASAIEKKENEFRCYIIDTLPAHDHINCADHRVRNKYLCDNLKGKKDIKLGFERHLKACSERKVQVV